MESTEKTTRQRTSTSSLPPPSLESGEKVQVEKTDPPPILDTRDGQSVLAAGTPPPSYDNTHRTLKNRHIQLIGIGGTIGTALFVQIGASLAKGGPGSLFIAFTIWCTFILAVNNCLSEMVTWIPISSPFVRYADRFVDPALGFCAGVNFFVFEAALVPYEIVAFNLILQFWTDKIPTGAVIAVVLIAYALLNVFAVKWYGESEFWLAAGKVILIVGLMCFTFVAMVGGNPLGERFGFSYFNPNKVPGAPFAEHIKKGDLGRFLGFLACLIQASFTIAGPDYVSMAAGEAELPRKNMPRAFHSVFYRLTAFFVFGSLCVGIIVPYNSPALLSALSDARPGAGSSPYVIAMERLNIKGLPHIVNFLVLSAVFSAGNSYVFCASRTLFGLALEGRAPRIFAKCTKSGVPLYSVGLTLAIALLAFLQVSNNAAVVLQWFINLVTASQLLNYAIISFTYLRFHQALKVQGISRDTLPHRSFWQPFCAYYAFTGNVHHGVRRRIHRLPAGKLGCTDIPLLLRHDRDRTCLFIGWKVIHKTTWRNPKDVTFFEAEREQVDEYEANFVPVESNSKLVKFWDRISS